MQTTDNRIKKALIYARVSTEEQAKEGYSLDAQEKFCGRFAKDNGYRITGVYRDEGKSATTLDRPALQDLLAKCQQEKAVDAIFVQETDRLARNTKDHLTIRAILKKAGVKLISVAQPMLDDSPEGNMIDTILASVNQFQSDINSRKTKKGLQERFDSGWWPGWAPLGYAKKELGNGKSIVVPDTEKFHLVRRAFKMYLTGNYSAVEIVEKLHEKGLRSKTGKKVPYSIMTHILSNPFYAGIMDWNNQQKPGKHPAMITPEEHKQILSIMGSHNRHACRRRKYNFLLRGFVFCGICGQRYVAEKHRRGKEKDYYHCSARSVQHSNGGQNIESKELEKQIEEQFKGIQFSEDFINLTIKKVKKFYQEKKAENESQKRVLLNRKMSIERKRNRAEEKLIADTLADEDFVRIRDRFKEEIYSLQDQICELDRSHDVDIDTLREALMLSRDVYKTYKKALYEIKRLYLSFFWEGFWMKDRKIIKAKPTQLMEALLKERKLSDAKLRGGANRACILTPNWLRW